MCTSESDSPLDLDRNSHVQHVSRVRNRFPFDFTLNVFIKFLDFIPLFPRMCI